MTDLDVVSLVNRSLAEIGRPTIVIDTVDRDLIDLGLTSIDRLMLIAKMEILSSRKIDVRKLGTSSKLTVSQLASALT